jgi:hypothetical protein
MDGRPAFENGKNIIAHCQDFGELIGNVPLSKLPAWVRLNNRLHFSSRYEIKCLVEIFGTVLLGANYLNAFRDEIHERDRKRLCVGTSNQYDTFPRAGLTLETEA